MGRGRVQLKRIENKISRQVTFSKRRSGLMKKANEISVLCDADVALIVFSTNGKLFEFSTDSSMNRILERYEQYTVVERRTMATNSEPERNPTLEYPKLLMKMEMLQKNLRNYLGEGLELLSMRELQSLEQQLDSSLKRIRTKKNQLLHESISQIQKKERALQVENKVLVNKIKESEKAQCQGDHRKQQYIAHNPPIFMLPPSQPSRLHALPSLTIGGPFETMESLNEEDNEAHTRPITANTQIPPWMLRHVNDQS